MGSSDVASMDTLVSASTEVLVLALSMSRRLVVGISSGCEGSEEECESSTEG